MFDMHGKVTIITGGTGGIGYEVARGLAEAGSDIALWYFTATGGSELSAVIEKDFGVRCKAYRCDVSIFKEVIIWPRDVVQRQLINTGSSSDRTSC